MSGGTIAINEVQDHCSLDIGSSTVRFRSTGTTARVFPSADSQFIVEDDVDDDGTRRVMAKRVNDTSPGLKFLRAAYSLVTLFFVRVSLYSYLCALAVAVPHRIPW